MLGNTSIQPTNGSKLEIYNNHKGRWDDWWLVHFKMHHNETKLCLGINTAYNIDEYEILLPVYYMQTLLLW